MDVKRVLAIFVDDFIGTGEQAIKTLRSYFLRYDWLKSATVYYCALVGFEEGIREIRKAMLGLIQDIFAFERLDEKDKAFSVSNPIWKSDEAREKAKEWAADIRRQVLVGRPSYDPERDKLGWGDSQALVAFHYNVPNNTLPLFWGIGQRNDKRWKPLFDRYD